MCDRKNVKSVFILVLLVYVEQLEHVKLIRQFWLTTISRRKKNIADSEQDTDSRPKDTKPHILQTCTRAVCISRLHCSLGFSNILQKQFDTVPLANT